MSRHECRDIDTIEQTKSEKINRSQLILTSEEHEDDK